MRGGGDGWERGETVWVWRMTEEEWVACTNADEDTGAMQEYLRGKGSPRKLRLFACACCRHIEKQLTDARSQDAVNAAEKYADGVGTDRDLSAAWEAADRAAEEIDDELDEEDSFLPYHAALAALWSAISEDDYTSIELASHSAYYALRSVESTDEPETQGRFLCDILGCPPSLSLDPSWLTPTVITLAQLIYNDRTFADLPILADALEDAGCDNEDILSHCRGDSPHVRGCWVLDLLLGKQ
jgi:hypothetical protein